MASKVKMEPAVMRRFERKEKRRAESTKQIRYYYLIVCEGEKTEPHYFESLRDALPPHVLDVCSFTIQGTGYNTRTLVDKAIKERKKLEIDRARKIDKLWVVFDKDSFTAEEFNAAIQICNAAENTEAAWTNEAFELWYLLHFDAHNTALSREQYKPKIEAAFKAKGLNSFKYKKNSREMFSLLSEHGSLAKAIQRAEALHNSYGDKQDYAEQNPCTTLYSMVAHLLNLADELTEEI